MPAHKPDLRELVGRAVNATRLAHEPGRESHLDRVAALGAAQLRVSSGAERQRLEVAAMDAGLIRRSADMRSLMVDPARDEPDPRDALSAELAGVLWHIRYGDQRGLVPAAIRLFARWIEGRRVMSDMAGPEHERRRFDFCTLVMHEWLSDKCRSCGGSGKQERSRTGQYLRPRGSMQRNAVFRACDACGGGGRAAPAHPVRTRILGMSRAEYEEQRWPQRFRLALTWLDSHPRLLYRPLTTELERRKKRF